MISGHCKAPAQSGWPVCLPYQNQPTNQHSSIHLFIFYTCFFTILGCRGLLLPIQAVKGARGGVHPEPIAELTLKTFSVTTFQAFVAEFCKDFGQGISQPAAASKLLTLSEGQGSVLDYGVEFPTGQPKSLIRAFCMGSWITLYMLVSYEAPITAWQSSNWPSR